VDRRMSREDRELLDNYMDREGAWLTQRPGESVEEWTRRTDARRRQYVEKLRRITRNFGITIRDAFE